MASGIKNMLFWIGHIVDREDGQNFGRVKVKVFGIHGDLEGEVEADDLPWAPVVDGTYGGMTSVPRKGEWVLGAFMDGRDGQHPIVLGRIPGYPTQLPSGSGQPGESGQWTAAAVTDLGRPPLHPAVIGEGAEELSGPILASASRTDVEDAVGRTHQEPETRLPTRNLDVRVMSSTDNQNYIAMGAGSDGYLQITTGSGSLIQIDDSGAVYIKSTGSSMMKTEGTKIERVEGDMNTQVSEGDWTLKVDANGKMYFGGDLDIECENFNLTVRGDSVFNVARTSKWKAANIDMFSHTDNINLVSASKIKTQSVGLTTLQSEAGFYVRAKDKLDLTAKSMKMTSDEEGIDIRAETDLKIDSWSGVIGIDAATNLHIKGRDNINIEGGSLAHLNAPTVYIDDTVRMAEGKAAGKYEWQETTVAEMAEEDLDEKAVAPGLPEPGPTQSPSGHKAQQYPHATGTVAGNTGKPAESIEI